METGQGNWPLFAALRVPRGARGPGPWRKDHTQWGQVLDRRGVSRDRRRDVQLGQRGMEPRLNTCHQVPAKRLLPPQLSAGP